MTGKIAFRGACDQPGIGIYTIRPDGSQMRRVSYSRYWPLADPDWSPNGAELAYAGAVSSELNNIYIRDANGKHPRQVTRNGGEQPAWSPDGKYIAFVNGNGLYVIGRNGHGLRRIASVPPQTDITKPWLVLSSPSWQPLPLKPRSAAHPH